MNTLTEEECGYLAGIFAGDGYRHYNVRDRHYIVEFYLNSQRDQDIILFLTDLLRRAGFNPRTRKDIRFNVMRIRVASKEFFQWVARVESSLPSGDAFRLGFSSGVIDAEGSVSREKSTLQVFNTDKELLEIVQECLQKNGIKSTLQQRVRSVKDTKSAYRLTVSMEFKHIKTLSCKGGRLKGSRQRGRSLHHAVRMQ